MSKKTEPSSRTSTTLMRRSPEAMWQKHSEHCRFCHSRARATPGSLGGMHRAWFVAAAGFVALLAAAAIRATFGILMEPLMTEFGWSHAAISSAASINLVVFGLSAPFAAALTERFGLRRVVV